MPHNGYHIGDDQSEWVTAFRGIKSILDDAGIVYWADMGTLLGLIRNGRLIVGDTDIDVSAKLSEAPRVLALIPKFAALGYQVVVNDAEIYFNIPNRISIGIAFLQTTDSSAWIQFIVRPPRFDRLLKYFRRVAERIIYADLHRNLPRAETAVYRIIPRWLRWPIRRCLFGICQLFGEQQFAMVFPRWVVDSQTGWEFSGMTLRIPHPAEDYIRLVYGDDWRVPNSRWRWEDVKAIDWHNPIRRRSDYHLFGPYDRD